MMKKLLHTLIVFVAMHQGVQANPKYDKWRAKHYIKALGHGQQAALAALGAMIARGAFESKNETIKLLSGAFLGICSVFFVRALGEKFSQDYYAGLSDEDAQKIIEIKWENYRMQSEKYRKKAQGLKDLVSEFEEIK